MTGGRIKRIAKYIDDDDFLLTYGDGVSDVDIANLLAFHQSARQNRHRHHRPPAFPLRHSRTQRRQASHPVYREAASSTAG